MKTEEENVLLTALGQRSKNYQSQLRACRREFSEEAVHDLRIAARRLLAVLDMLHALDPQPDVQNVRRLIKGQFDNLDELRDVQVMLVEVAEDAPWMAELDRFQPYLAKREKRLLRLARDDIKHLRLPEVRKRVEMMRDSVELPIGSKATDRLLLQAVDQAYSRLELLHAKIDRGKPGTIHQTRIAFKKFRYMVEIVGPALPEPPEDYFRCMHDYQSTMGDIRDVTIFTNTLHELARQHTLDLAWKPISRYFAKRLEVLISAFMANKDELRTFWRRTPEDSFPWQADHHSARRRRSSGPRRAKRRQPAVSKS